MVHAAIHDAVNAIDGAHARMYSTAARGSASPDAAVAAAARDVLVSVISTLPESPECRAAGIADADGSYAAALAAIPDGPAKTTAWPWDRLLQPIIPRRAEDGSNAATRHFDYHN